jgi:hypothetical protein
MLPRDAIDSMFWTEPKSAANPDRMLECHYEDSDQLGHTNEVKPSNSAAFMTFDRIWSGFTRDADVPVALRADESRG